TGSFASQKGWTIELYRGVDGNHAERPIEVLTVDEPSAPQSFSKPLLPGSYFAQVKDTAGILRKIANFGVMPEKKITLGIMVTDPEISGAAQRKFKGYEAGNLRKIITDYSAAGVNLFAVTNIWPWYQSTPETIDFKLADKIVESCRQAGVRYQLKIQQWSLPKNFLDLERVRFQNGKEGRALSLWDERMIALYIRIWEKTVARYSGDPSLFSYAPTFGLEENSIGNDYGGNLGGMADYNAVAEADWKIFLQKKFSNEEIAALYCGSPGKMQLPRPDIHGSKFCYRKLWMTFLEFRFNRVAAVYRRVFSAIRAQDAATPITFKFGKLFPFEVECGPAGSNGYDFESIFKLAREFKVRPAYTILSEPVNAALTWGFADLYGVPLWAEGGEDPEGAAYKISDEERSRDWQRGTTFRMPIGESRAMMVPAFLIAMAYQTGGFEIPYYPVINPKELWPALSAQLALADGFRMRAGKTYLGYFPERMWGAQPKPGAESDLGTIYTEFSERVRQRIRWGFPFRVITAETLKKLPPDAIIFDPGTVEMTAETATAIRQFVSRGGTFICNQFTAQRGEGSTLLAEMLGVPMEQIPSSGEILTSENGIKIYNKGLSGFKLKPKRTILSIADRQIAFVQQVGRGQVVFNGVPFSMHPELEPEILAAAGEPRSPYHSSLRPDCYTLENDRGEILIAVGNRDDEELSGYLQLPPELSDRRVIDQVTGEDIPVSEGKIPCRIANGMFRLFRIDGKAKNE
ncbi:MAG: hypothetical protein AB7F32_12330, partial [Victivallaceae bacterium]